MSPGPTSCILRWTPTDRPRAASRMARRAERNSEGFWLRIAKHGTTHPPVFSNDRTKVAWAELAGDGCESDHAVLVVYDLKKDESYKLTSCWDRSPASISFSEDDKYIYFTAGSKARVKVFVLPVPASKPGSDKKLASPFKPTDEHTTSAIQPLPGSRLLYFQNSFTKPNDVHLTRGLNQLPASVSQLTRFTEELNGKSLDAGEEFYFDGAEMKIQGWILKLKGYRKNNRSVCSTGVLRRCCPPSGSTTFGQDLTDAIKGGWGGKPLVDLQKGWQYILDVIDRDHAVAAGADYGGWIQRNPGYGFGLKALVCHDGVFDSQYGEYSTDEHYFFKREIGEQPWKDKTREFTRRFSPSNHVHKWSTPESIIQGNKNYRLPEAVGIAASHALQQQGAPSRLAMFPDGNHRVLNHGNSLKWHYEVFCWLNQFVGKDNANQKCSD
ncbi:alpha/beta-hydrolase [Thelephora ganbajun]|uniref:Alpha/beta-hydrolase n=1 Tax=Thelephora ganbajun TaxID=370292 RepID=A0ACB6ZK86_THEGA|nr:alpha/beta-hydrolase [Thelephora ganbajun]